MKQTLNKIKILIGTIALAVTFLYSSAITHAAINNPVLDPALGGTADSADAAKSGSIFTSYFLRIWEFIITVGGLMVLVYFLWGGIEWITAGGDSSKIQKARDKIIQSIIGMIVLVGTFVIISFINDIFFQESFDLLNISF